VWFYESVAAVELASQHGALFLPNMGKSSSKTVISKFNHTIKNGTTTVVMKTTLFQR
jgi:hypothetical protein